jgi:protoporphyrinogen oxidase
MSQDTIIIGAGPAGLTAGLELVRAGRTGVTILEATQDIGGLSKTVNYKGNRIDIGGHRFFSKSDWVMNWWRDILPVALPPGAGAEGEFRLAYQGAQRLLGAHEIHAKESDESVMMVRNRLSRIYWGGKFFDYPLKPNLEMALKLGPAKCLTLGSSYAYSAMRPITPERSLEDFFINRFGRQLYRTFFKEYTEKVWGVPCNEISAAWGAQRVKSLSISKALMHALRKAVTGGGAAEQTSLIENFLYPKYGPGQMWETVAQRFQAAGGRIIKGATVSAIERDENRVTRVRARHEDGQEQSFEAGQVISTMPVRELVQAMRPAPTPEVLGVGSALQYRDFITVGLLYRKLRKTASASLQAKTNMVPDNWIYIQDSGVKVGRLQIFNNWSPYMVADPDTVWIGLEFFARDDDSLWAMSDEQLKALAIREMRELKLADEADALDATVIRMPKAYPGYFGSAYERFDEVKDWLGGMSNLYLVGRNGMHRYNNQDHSMLSARIAAQSILTGKDQRSAIWAVNIDDDYHEQGEEAKQAPDAEPSAVAA